MSFSVAAAAYLRFMGRFSEPLAPLFADAAGIPDHGLPDGRLRVVDVGCGPGALTAVLFARLGAEAVVGVEPSPTFVAAARQRLPGVVIEQGSAESLPLPDAGVDAALAQLVVHFMADPVAGLREMHRVTRPGGTVAACVWDGTPGGGGPVTPFWDAARTVDPTLVGEGRLAGSAPGDLARLFHAAGLDPSQDTSLTVRIAFSTFDQWWEPYTLGVGPAGDFVQDLDPGRLNDVRDACRQALGPGPFDLDATAWFVRATVPS